MSSSDKSFSLALFFCLNLILFSSLAIAQPIVPESSPTTNCSGNVSACASVIDFITVSAGSQEPVRPCCDLIQGLVATNAKICLNLALDLAVDINPISVNTSVDAMLDILVNTCNN